MLKNRIKLSVAGTLATLLLATAPVAAGNMNDNHGHEGNDNEHNKVTLCHATGSTTNPYVEITINANGAVNGHAGHANDIIPPFNYNNHGMNASFPGLNWDAKGQATLNNNCVPGGQGGGGQPETPPTPPTTPTQNQVMTTTTTPAGRGAGQVSVAAPAAPQVQAPVGAVSAGEGGGSALSAGAIVGLIGSLGSVVTGLALSKKFHA